MCAFLVRLFSHSIACLCVRWMGSLTSLNCSFGFPFLLLPLIFILRRLYIRYIVTLLIFLITDIGCAMSGLVSDARTLVEHARVETQHHWFTYDEKITTEAAAQSISDLALGYGEGNMARPFGVSLLIGGVDEKGPALYHTDPSGTLTKYEAHAIGAGSEGAQLTLKEQYNKSMTLKEAQKLALEILKQVMEEKINETNVEMAVIPTSTGIYTVCEQSEVKTIIADLSPDLI